MTAVHAQQPGETAAAIDALRLDDQLCFAVHAASRAFDAVYRCLLADSGLTYPQYLVMLVLWQRGPLPMKALGGHLRLDSGTLSPLVRRLETAGLVTRERSSTDERSVIIGLTEAGRQMRKTIDPVPAGVIAATDLTREHATALLSELRTLTAALETAAST